MRKYESSRAEQRRITAVKEYLELYIIYINLHNPRVGSFVSLSVGSTLTSNRTPMSPSVPELNSGDAKPHRWVHFHLNKISILCLSIREVI